MNAKMLLIHYPYGLRIVCVKSLSEDFIINSNQQLNCCDL